jgi:hypothetical protein
MSEQKQWNTREFITELSEDFTDDYLVTPELQQRFIEQVLDYVEGECCTTEQELYCFVDGLLMNIY